jgi:hypothetical protein
MKAAVALEQTVVEDTQVSQETAETVAEVLTVETTPPMTVAALREQLVATASVLATRLVDTKKGLSPGAGQSIQSVITAIGILSNTMQVEAQLKLQGVTF